MDVGVGSSRALDDVTLYYYDDDQHHVTLSTGHAIDQYDYAVDSPTASLPPSLEEVTQDATTIGKWNIIGVALLIVGTACGNLLVCIAVCRERSLHNMANYFLMSLAIADLLVSVFVMPVGMAVLVFGNNLHYIFLIIVTLIASSVPHFLPLGQRHTTGGIYHSQQ